MNEQKWRSVLESLTGDYGKKFDCSTKEGHLGFTIGFYKALKIDKKNLQLLDVGCSDEKFREEIQATWHGLDLQPRGPNVIRGDAHEIPSVEKHFDIVFCSHTLEHTVSPLLVLAEMHRVLKDDGHVVVGVPVDPDFMGDDHNYVLTSNGWQLLFRRAGFKAVAAQDVGHGCFCYHLRKREEV